MTAKKLSYAVAVLLTACGQLPGSEQGAAEGQADLPSAGGVNAAVISTVTPGATSTLGGGWDALEESFTGSNCMTDTYRITTTPQSTGTLQLNRMTDSASVSSSLGVSINAKARIGMFGGSVKARYARSSVTNELSISTYYQGRFDTQLESLDPYHYGHFVDPTNPNWYRLCGDQFVAARHRGGDLWIRFTISFDTAATRQAFAADTRISYGSVVDLSGSVTGASADYKGKAWVSVDAMQVGGVVTDLSRIVGGHDDSGVRAFLDCSVENMTACNQFLQNGITYATSLAAGNFIAGVKASPADLQYDLVRYDSAYVAGATATPPAYRSAPAAVEGARASLRQLLDTNLALYDRVVQLQGAGAAVVNQALGGELDAKKAQLTTNLAALETVWARCWDVLDPAVPASVAACVSAPSTAALAPLGFATSVTMPQLQTSARIPVHRLYRPGYHLHSLSTTEGYSLGYRLEIQNNFYTEKSSRDGSVPLYRCKLSKSGRYMMTTSAACEGAGVNEGSFGYVMTSQIDGAVPLYRWYNSSNGDHISSLTAAPPSGWRLEGNTGYAWAAP